MGSGVLVGDVEGLEDVVGEGLTVWLGFVVVFGVVVGWGVGMGVAVAVGMGIGVGVEV